MTLFTLTVTIEADTLEHAWAAAANLPPDFTPPRLEALQSLGLLTFRLEEMDADRPKVIEATFGKEPS